MADSSAFLTAMATVANKYPTLMNFLNTQPELMSLYLQSINENWSPEQLQSKLQATSYYRNTTQDQRNWDQLAASDRATADQRYRVGTQHNTALWQTFANNVDYNTFVNLSNQAIRGNWSDDTFKAALAGVAAGQPPPTDLSGQGDLGANISMVKQIAASYAVPVSDQSAYQYAINMLNGQIDQAGITNWAKEQAGSLFPALKTALDAGLTVDQYASPYKQIAQQELGTNPGDISWTDPKWQAALSQVDPKTGARTSMSLSDWTTKLRTDAVYGFDQTQGAKNQAVDFATKIGQALGKVA